MIDKLTQTFPQDRFSISYGSSRLTEVPGTDEEMVLNVAGGDLVGSSSSIFPDSGLPKALHG
jgi:hypothetical protein